MVVVVFLLTLAASQRQTGVPVGQLPRPDRRVGRHLVRLQEGRSARRKCVIFDAEGRQGVAEAAEETRKHCLSEHPTSAWTMSSAFPAIPPRTAASKTVLP